MRGRPWTLATVHIQQRLILYASFYGIASPQQVPYLKGTTLKLQDYKIESREIEYEYHNDYVRNHTYNATEGIVMSR